MPANLLEAQVRHQPDLTIIDLQGELDGFAKSSLQAAFAEAAAASGPTERHLGWAKPASPEGPNAILLNFKEVHYINSTGIALLVGLIVQARRAGRRLFAGGLSDHYREIFQITRLVDFLTIYEDETAVAADAGKSSN